MRLDLVAGLQPLELVAGLDRIGFEDIPGTRGIPSLVQDLSVSAVAEAGDGRVGPFFGPPVPIEADDALVIYPPEAGRIARLVAGPCPRAEISTLRKNPAPSAQSQVLSS